MSLPRRRRRPTTSGGPLSPVLAGVLVFFAMLSSTLLIPALRPFFAAVHPGEEGALYWFNVVNMLGALVGAPLLGAIADATGRRGLVLVVASVVDGALLFLCSLALPVPLVLLLRLLQGAGNVGALALLMSLTTPRGIPVAGGATVAAIAAGVPLGTVLLRSGPEVPFQLGAMLPLMVAATIAALQPTASPERRAPGSLVAAARLVVGPGVFVFAERFAIGLFIVPFSLFCHDVRGLNDAMVGRLYAAFLVPFAVMTALVPRTAIGPVASVVTGAVAYAGCLFAVGHVEATPVLSLVLLIGGIGAALVYAPSLRIASRIAPARAAAAMGALQGLGALGMFLGGALARLLAELLAGAPRADALRAPFHVGGAGLLVLLAAGLAPFARAARTIAAADDEDRTGSDVDGSDVDGSDDDGSDDVNARRDEPGEHDEHVEGDRRAAGADVQ